MNNKKIDIKLIDSWPEKEIINLYKSAGWWKDYYDSSKIKYMIKGSFAFAIAIDRNSNKAVGMGRVLSDGISDAYIQDLVVLQDYRGNGIGSKILEALLKYCISKKIIWIGLIAEPGQNGFYSKFKFKTLKRYIPMKYENDD